MDTTGHHEDILKIRQRLHDISDTVHGHGIRLELHSLELVNIKKTIEGLQHSMATSEQLDAATELVHVKLDHVSDELGQIKKFIMGGVGLVLTAVVVAILSIVIKGTP